MLLNGSGLWFTNSRAPAFAEWEEKATPPHSRITAISVAGSNRPTAAKAINAAPAGRRRSSSPSAPF